MILVKIFKYVSVQTSGLILVEDIEPYSGDIIIMSLSLLRLFSYLFQIFLYPIAACTPVLMYCNLNLVDNCSAETPHPNDDPPSKIPRRSLEVFFKLTNASSIDAR